MGPQDKVERVLKEIHVTFSQCPTYNGEPDKIIVDRKQFLSLLDRLNNGIFDMMDQYEQTRQSRQTAERAFKKKGEEIIETANSSADDIYAASVLYTADMIGRIRELMDVTNESMNDLFIHFRKELREQKDLLRSHETELQAQLIDLSDTKKYLTVLQDINKERERESREHLAQMKVEEAQRQEEPHTPAKPAEVKVNEEYFEKTKQKRPDTPVSSSAEKPDIVVNKDAAYFKWKASQDAALDDAPLAGEHAEHSGDAPRKDPAPEQIRSGDGDPEDDFPDEELPEEEFTFTDEELGLTDADFEFAEEEFTFTDEELGLTGDIDALPEEDTAEPGENGRFDSGHPDEETIRQAVLRDEMELEMQSAKPERKSQNGHGAGHILKNLIFGKDVDEE